MSETEALRHPLVEARRLRGWSQEGLAALLQKRVWARQRRRSAAGNVAWSLTVPLRWHCVTSSE
jgi:hypothetical protein